MHLHHRAALLFIAAALASQPVLAQGGMAKQLQARFTAADVNHDGKLTKPEAQAGMPRLAPFFDQIDPDHTGSITFAQITAFMAQQRQGGHG